MIQLSDYKHRGFRFTGRSGHYDEYPFTVSGELWLSERETSAMAARAIIALNPGMDIQDDSENGGVIYLNVKTEADARRLIDSLIEQGRVEDIDPEVYARERADALLAMSFMPDATNENVRQVIRDDQARVETMRRFPMEYPE